MDGKKLTMFGMNFGDAPQLTAEIEEFDALNDETFGGEPMPDLSEWDIEDLSEQTESVVDQNVKTEKYNGNDSDDALEEMVEKSIFNLMADDDFPLDFRGNNGGRPISKLIQQENEMRNIFGSNSPQNPFFQFSQNQSNIWGSFGVEPPRPQASPPQPNVVTPAANHRHNEDAMQKLLAQLNITSTPAAAADSPKINLKNAKTVEELEAELLASAAQTKNGGENTTDVNKNHQNSLHLLNLLSAAHQNQNQQQHQNAPPLPQLMPPWMLNPQIRAAVFACLAAGKPLPPGILPPPPPPPFLRMPFLPPNMPRPPGFPPHQAQRLEQLQQRGGSNFRLVGNSNVGRQQRYTNKDPFAGLMSRREREWLIKIQCLQSQVENPLVDDYYWTMMQRKKALEAKKDERQRTSSTSVDSPSSHDLLEHRTYVPPTFEGSLGKVQFSSVNCPRMLIDVGQSESRTPPSTSSSFPSLFSLTSTPSPLLKSGNHNSSRSKKLTGLLLDIENAYVSALECEEITLMRDASSQTSRDFSDIIIFNAQKCLNLIGNQEKFAGVLNSRKGRRLIGKTFRYVKNEQMSFMLRALFAALSNSTRKEILDDVSISVASSLRENFETNDVDINWTEILASVSAGPPLANILKLKVGYVAVLTLLFYCAKGKTCLNEDTKTVVQRCSSIFATEICPLSDVDAEMTWFGRTQLAILVSWLTNIVGVDPFVVDRCENQWRNLLK